MNVVDSMHISSALEKIGCHETSSAEEADVIVLNTCVVRQSAEDKAYNKLISIKSLKKKNPNLVINLMGCLVGLKDTQALYDRFPYVDVFSPPSDTSRLINYLIQKETIDIDRTHTENINTYMDEEFEIPSSMQGRLVSAFIPVVLGCSHACTYCVIPYRRGAEGSRSPDDIIKEARGLVNQGVREITLLGQIVDRYGLDKIGYPTLDRLIFMLNEIEDLERIRFLTSHPNYVTKSLLSYIAELPKVMPHLEIPVQAGDNEVLSNMHRGYSREQYYQLISNVRELIPDVSIGTDIIVGFPGETEKQFANTRQLLADLKLDVVHLARYSPRPNTYATRHMQDDIAEEEKWRRLRELENLQKTIVTEINQKYLGKEVLVLFEDIKKNRWHGRTPNNKLVFVESDQDLRGKLLPVQISWTGPWSMIGEVVLERVPK